MGCYYHPKLPTAVLCRDCQREICSSCSEEGVCPGCRLGRAMKTMSSQVPAKPSPQAQTYRQTAVQDRPAPSVADAAVATADECKPSSEERVLAALCYPLWPLALLLLLLPAAHGKFVRFHVLQSLGVNALGVALYAVYALSAGLPVVGWQSAFALPLLVPLWMLGDLYLAIRAAVGESPRVPFAADLASKFG